MEILACRLHTFVTVSLYENGMIFLPCWKSKFLPRRVRISYYWIFLPEMICFFDKNFTGTKNSEKRRMKTVSSCQTSCTASDTTGSKNPLLQLNVEKYWCTKISSKYMSIYFKNSRTIRGSLRISCKVERTQAGGKCRNWIEYWIFFAITRGTFLNIFLFFDFFYFGYLFN